MRYVLEDVDAVADVSLNSWRSASHNGHMMIIARDNLQAKRLLSTRTLFYFQEKSKLYIYIFKILTISKNRSTNLIEECESFTFTNK